MIKKILAYFILNEFLNRIHNIPVKTSGNTTLKNEPHKNPKIADAA